MVTTEVPPTNPTNAPPQQQWIPSSDTIAGVVGAAVFTAVGVLISKALQAWNNQTLGNHEIANLKEKLREITTSLDKDFEQTGIKLDLLKEQISEFQSLIAKNGAEQSALLNRIESLENRISSLEKVPLCRNQQ